MHPVIRGELMRFSTLISKAIAFTVIKMFSFYQLDPIIRNKKQQFVDLNKKFDFHKGITFDFNY